MTSIGCVESRCRATIFTGAQFFRDIDDRSWDPARRLEDMDRLGRRRAGTLAAAGDVLLTLARLNHGWGVRPEGPAAIPHEPRHYARRIWVDSLTLGASNLRVIVDELGLDRVVLGSDYPFDMGADDPVRAVESAELAPAARFLGLPAP